MEPRLINTIKEARRNPSGTAFDWLRRIRQAIREMLIETRWNRREAARRLRVSYKALLNKIKLIEEDGSGHSSAL